MCGKQRSIQWSDACPPGTPFAAADKDDANDNGDVNDVDNCLRSLEVPRHLSNN